MILDALGHKYGTDKASGGHDYLDFYQRFLAEMRDQKLTLLEIGVGSGGSLRMWQDYFLRARIIGMDCEAGKVEQQKERIEIIIGDQGSVADLNRVVEKYAPFDIIVDDAGHQDNYQVECYKRLLPHLNPGGYYILEDVGGSQCREYLRDLGGKVIEGHERIAFIAFYKDTSVTKVK